MKTEPYQHQREAHEKSILNNVFAYFMEQGTGKTLCALMDCEYFYERGDIDSLLVVAPNGVYQNWAYNEMDKHWSHDYRSFVWNSQKAGTKKFEQAFNDFNKFNGFKVFCINVDALNTKQGYQYANKFLNNKCLLIVDESTKISNPKAKRTVNIVTLGKKAVYKRIATGTPVATSPLGLYAQISFLDKSILNVKNYHVFRHRYADWKKRPNPNGGSDFEELVRYKNLEELKARIEPYSYRVLKQECLDLPEKIFESRYFELTPKQRQVYEQLKEEAVAELSDTESVSAPIVLTKLLRLQQITCNFVVDEDDKQQKIDDTNPRLNLLQDVLEECHGQAIIWCRFKQDIDIICQSLQNAVRYDGRVGNDDRQKAIDSFQAGDVKYFVANPQAGGTGLNLTAANTVIWYSHDFSLETYLQANDRAHRIGQHDPVTYIDLIADRSVDGKIVEALKNKQEISNIVTGDNLKEML